MIETELIHESRYFNLSFEHTNPPRWVVEFNHGTRAADPNRTCEKNYGRDLGQRDYFRTVGSALTFVTDRSIRLDPELKAVSDHLTALRQEIKEIGSRVIIL